MANIYCGIGAVGDSGNVRALVSADSANITTPAQYAKTLKLDPLDDSYTAISFVTAIPDVGEATALTLYINKDGAAKWLATAEATEYTVV